VKAGLSPVGAPDDPLRQSHPNLAAWLTFRSWDGLQPREPARLSFSPNPTGFVVSISGYTEGQKCAVKVTHLGEWLDALEAALSGDGGDWSELEQGKGAQRLKSERRKLLDARNASSDDDS
jgi:hypothetical protein